MSAARRFGPGFAMYDQDRKEQMVRRTIVLTLMVATALLFVASCKSNADKDKAALKALVESDTTHFPAGTKGDSTEGSLADDTTIAFWWRGPQTHDPAPGLEVYVSGDSAWVAWSQHNYGDLFIWAKTSETTAVRWTKNLVEASRLHAVFTRGGRVSDTDRGWRLKKITLAVGQSESTHTVTIDSLRIQSSLRDTLIKDPLNTFYSLDSLVTFTPAEQLTLTLYTNADGGQAFLHAFWGLLLVRIPFQSQGGGVFTGTWNAQVIPGFRFAIFDLLGSGTIQDPTTRYNFDGWLLPYMIKSAD